MPRLTEDRDLAFDKNTGRLERATRDGSAEQRSDLKRDVWVGRAERGLQPRHCYLACIGKRGIDLWCAQAYRHPYDIAFNVLVL